MRLISGGYKSHTLLALIITVLKNKGYKAVSALRMQNHKKIYEIMIITMMFLILFGIIGCEHKGKLSDDSRVKIQTDLHKILADALTFKLKSNYHPQTLNELKDGKDKKGNQIILNVVIPKDPWGNDYSYKLINGEPQLTCLGKDGIEGGEGENKDISVR